MSVLFEQYALLAQSGWFDAEFYRRANPDVTALNVDPLTHYLEVGAQQGRDPSARFDTAHYLSQCQRHGRAPNNPLYHFLTEGVALGLSPQPVATFDSTPPGNSASESLVSITAPAGLLCVDAPRIVSGFAQMPVYGGLSIVGWGMARDGVVGIDVSVDDAPVCSARVGLRRPDVAAAHPGWPGALTSGFVAQLPPKALLPGTHRISIALRDERRQVSRVEFSVEAQTTPADRPPWALRRKMRQAEALYGLSILHRQRYAPEFRITLRVGHGKAALAAARRTLESLERQAYPHWTLRIAPAGWRGAAALRGRITREALLGRLDHCRARAHGPARRGRGDHIKSPRTARFAMILAAGDELGVDALLEFALASSLQRDADLLYGDDLRHPSPATPAQPFFKPGWSPDLLLSSNYIGRAFVFRSELLDKAGIPDEAEALGDYERALRLTGAAHRIAHVPRLLISLEERESEKQEFRALTRALHHRQISAQIRAGDLPGTYRIDRSLKPGRVSIIIPTRGANGFIRACLETLRSRTAYRDYEILCVENIPKRERDLRAWVSKRVDRLLPAPEPFNWSSSNNLAVTQASGEYLLFLNDDIEIIDPDWLEILLTNAQRSEVGIVGPLLLYPDRSVQQAGMHIDSAGRSRHSFRHLDESDPGYFGLARTQRNVLAVTGACLMTRRNTFDQLGGFNEAHAVINNDLDYCLKVHQKGLLTVYTPHARLIHHEMGSRGGLPEDYDGAQFDDRWHTLLSQGDPYFHPGLTAGQDEMAVDPEPLESVYCGPALFDSAAIRRILVVKLDHIGDAVTALPAVRRLKQLYPKAHLALLAGRGTASLWKKTPEVDEVIEFNLFHVRSGDGLIPQTEAELRQLEQRLIEGRFDLAVDLRKQPDTRAILQRSGAQWLAGYDTQGRFPWLDVALEWDEDAPLRAKHGHVSDDLLLLIEAIGLRGGRSSAAEFTARHSSWNPRPVSSGAGKSLVCIHPGSGSVMRQWPTERFAELIELLLADTKHEIAILGGPDDVPLAEGILRGVRQQDRVRNYTGKLSLEQTGAIIARCVLFIGNNSGPQHLAASQNVPVIGIHSGVVDALEWGPRNGESLALRRVMSCSPCYLERPQDCTRALTCIRELPASAVHQASLRAIALSPAYGKA